MDSRIALFGGTFDPIHWGHLNSARSVLDLLDLDRLIFVPNNVSPYKRNHPVTPGAHRLEMIRLAIADEPRFELSDFEINRPGPSYTVDTVSHFREQFGESVELFWIVGADSLADLAGWYRLEKLLDLCEIVTVARPGWEQPDLSPLRGRLTDQQIQRLKDNCLVTPLTDVASTTIRQCVRANRSIDSLVPPPVAKYIARHGLYH
jgi:nicotinate-nucleotide adenylyltransferase